MQNVKTYKIKIWVQRQNASVFFSKYQYYNTKKKTVDPVPAPSGMKTRNVKPHSLNPTKTLSNPNRDLSMIWPYRNKNSLSSI